MIVNLRGTSGSGKTTAMREVMTYLKNLTAVHVGSRKRPLYYVGTANKRLVAVVGPYEAVCGGCDGIGSAAQVFEVVKQILATPNPPVHLLCEGLILSEDTKWALQYKDLGQELRCVFLNTTLDTCLERIRGRRAAKGNDKPLNVENTSNRVRTIDRARVKLEAAGIVCRTATSEQTPLIVRKWLGI